MTTVLYGQTEPAKPVISSSVTVDVKLYPNPVTSLFYIQSDVKLRRVEVYSILGEKIKEFRNPSLEDAFYIDDLDRGIYLISILDENSKVLKTLRISKQ